jgi:hypothetical protein
MHGEGGHHVMGAPMRRRLCVVCALRRCKLCEEWRRALPVVNAAPVVVLGRELVGANANGAGPALVGEAGPHEVSVDFVHEGPEGGVLHAAVGLAIPAPWEGEEQRGNGE